MYLFFDSSEYLTLGLLNEAFEWESYQLLTTKKNSEIFHGFLFEMLSKKNLKLKDISGVFQIAGPGSYTGMRLSEGMCQFLEWQGLSVYSFYHFQVPALLGDESGAWISEAFKGEYFLYSWDAKKTNVELIPKAGREPHEIVSSTLSHHSNVYTHYDMGNFDCLFTSDLVKKQATSLFSIVKERKMRETPYYYRPLEKEFTPSLK